MTTTNAKVESVPSFWKKWWNAFVKCFKRDAARACSAERQPAPKTEDVKVQERKEAK